MSSQKRFGGTVNLCVPKAVNDYIRQRIADDGSTKSEVVRGLLEAGLRVMANQ